MPVSMDEVRKLREMTGAGVLECKKALEEAKGDIEKAKDILRIKGLAKAEKKAGRVTKEGLIYTYVSEDGKRGVILELNCETDFVARNEEFKKLAETIAKHIIEEEENRNKEGEGENILEQTIKSLGKKVSELIKEAIAKIGENIQIKRFARFDADDKSKLHTYTHGEGRIGVLLEYRVQREGDEEGIKRIVQDIAMQIAAMRPEYVSIEDVPEDVINKEKSILREQTLREGKPEHIVDKIVEGKLKKVLKEKVLLEQLFIKDDKKTVSDMLKEKGNIVAVIRFRRFELGGV